jgi:hypothetical protein
MGRKSERIGSWRPSKLPSLKPANHVISSDSSGRYNCFAWAAGDTNRWWEPTGRYYWPLDRREWTLSSFVKAFATKGYVRCANGSPEYGIEKIAIYATKEDRGRLEPQHAARQLADGRWTSKIGELEDINHLSLKDVNCRDYGSAVRFMKRAMPTE